MPADVDQQRREMENRLRMLTRQADEMDAKIRAYLADRENKPHPHHQEFIAQIQSLRVEPRILTKHLETLLDNLQWKVYYYSRAWRQLWDNADARRKTRSAESGNAEASLQAAGNKGTDDPGSNGNSSRIQSVDRLWQIQQEKLASLGQDPDSENRDAFVKRIKQGYGRLASEKRPDEEIVMTFDKQSRRCVLAVKKRSHVPEE